MKNKIILLITAIVAVSLGVMSISAFEAQVINVTARIENALTVPLETSGLSFGTVFPEEVLLKNLDIQLSHSFLKTDRVDSVEYLIRQKPKCGVPRPGTEPVSYSSYPQAMDEPDGTFKCPDQAVMLPLLCPYLSKREVDGENGIEAFHGPPTGWTMADTLASELTGRLSKAGNKLSASYLIDLHAPCFKGACAQDQIVPLYYQADPENEGRLYGCDLWVEVKGFNQANDPGNLIVVNTVFGGNKTFTDFPLFVDGLPIITGAGTTTLAGSHKVTLTEDPDYEVSFSKECPNGLVHIPAGGTVICTITNTLASGSLKVIKKILDGPAAPEDFIIHVINGIPAEFPAELNGTDVTIAGNTDYYVYESSWQGEYSASLEGDCQGIMPPKGQKICRITNYYDKGIIIVYKIVNNYGLGSKSAADFVLTIDGQPVEQNTPINVLAGDHFVGEADSMGYIKTIGLDCAPDGSITIEKEDVKNCLITNDYPH